MARGSFFTDEILSLSRPQENVSDLRRPEELLVSKSGVCPECGQELVKVAGELNVGECVNGHLYPMAKPTKGAT